MVDAQTPKQLYYWLKDKPVDWAQVVAARRALRALPAAMAVPHRTVKAELKKEIFRASIIAWAARNYPARDMVRAAKRVNTAIFASVDNSQSPTNLAYQAVRTIDDTGDAALFASSAASINELSHVNEEVVSDLHWLEDWIGTTQADQAARRLANRPLWHQGPHKSWLNVWQTAKKRLLSRDPAFEVWTDWYDRRVRGERSAFDIPGDYRRKEDKWLLRKIADATNEDFWDRGAEYVNGQVTQWLEEARARARERAQRDADLKALVADELDDLLEEHSKAKSVKKLQGAASPQATERNGKLDASPNAKFDAPLYSGELADLPATMRAFIKVLLNSLGANASAFMKSSLEGYEEELLVRSTQPILGTLKGLSQAIAREVWTAQSLATSDDPSAWELRDEREWGPGMADLFRTFAQYNADLIKHFPLDEEREELLRSTPIDEMAASGEALTDPVIRVTDGVRELHAEGLATDDILKIMEAHAQYNEDIASLPPPDPNLPDDYVTPKRRHVLMTAGFYLDLYSVLGSTASLAPVLHRFPSLIPQIQAAANQLLTFIV